jgi:hypothetical protein
LRNSADERISPFPALLMAWMPVLSISRCSGPFALRYGMLTASVFWRRQMVLKCMRRPLPIVNQLAVGFFAFVSAQNELIGDYRMSSF